MTGPDDSETSTRPISVAELLAKNGTIGAAPPGGRRRRRRGNADAVTVAELTGEIPIVRTGDIPVVKDEEPAPEPAEDESAPDEASQDSAAQDAATPEAAPTNGSAPETRSTPPELADVPVARRGPAVGPERSHFPMAARKTDQRGHDAAEEMSPDPVVEEPAAVDPVGADAVDLDVPEADEQPAETPVLQTYLRATSGPLFGGQTVADDLARQSRPADAEDTDLVVGDELEVEEALADTGADEPDQRAAPEGERVSKGQLAVRGLLIAVQSIVAVAFGAGLFVAFDQLWKWNSIVALILGVLVILGLVVGVRVVRKTEDIGSTLTAVAVGALVTFGPLALLQAS